MHVIDGNPHKLSLDPWRHRAGCSTDGYWQPDAIEDQGKAREPHFYERIEVVPRSTHGIL